MFFSMHTYRFLYLINHLKQLIVHIIDVRKIRISIATISKMAKIFLLSFSNTQPYLPQEL